MSSNSRAASLFDDIFQLQTTVPDIDPEDPEDGFKSGLTHGATGEIEVLGSTQLKKQAALILDDPKYRGKRTSRKELYSEDDEEETEFGKPESDLSDDTGSYADEEEEDDGSDVVDDDELADYGDGDEYEDDAEKETMDEKEKDATVKTPSDSNDREKGRAVSYQLGLWDDLIKCRISIQKMVTSCNRLPSTDVWERFSTFPAFQKESSDAHSSVRQVLSSLFELQQQILQKLPTQGADSKLEGSDEEITSESEDEDEKEGTKISKVKSVNGEKNDEDGDDNVSGEEEERNEDDMECDDDNDEDENDAKEEAKGKEETKRKLNLVEAEEILAKRHKEFQSFRNNTLAKWDEKTRLTHAKIKSKNFAAFDISVLKQIQQVLGNKGRLIRRIHQNRSSVRVLGHMATEDDKAPQEMVLEDDEDEVELMQRATRPEMDINYEIVDDSDFYQMCLRDFIQLKQNEETDPVLANKHWLEIQSLRKKHKRKVDTRASKGRKIRYHVKEKLKNFMAPYDKSTWNEEQKDDLFKALFGGKQSSDADGATKDEEKAPTINIGL